MDRQTSAAGEAVREQRLKANLPIIGLAFKSGVNPRTIERIEAGTVEPRRGTLLQLALALNVDPEQFGVRSPEAA